MQRIRDAIHELRIWWAKQCATQFYAEGYVELARMGWQHHADLIAKRSPQQVRRMERRAGLI